MRNSPGRCISSVATGFFPVGNCKLHLLLSVRGKGGRKGERGQRANSQSHSAAAVQRGAYMMQTSYHHLSYYHKYSKETFVMMNVRILLLLFRLVFRHGGIKTFTSRTLAGLVDSWGPFEAGRRVDEASLELERDEINALFVSSGWVSRWENELEQTKA